jgi:hypothetical protein
MKTKAILFLFALLAPVLGWGIPVEINYQGTLREGKLPVTAPRSMLFRITNQDGSKVYWSQEFSSVKVTNGYFSQVLRPTGIDWQSITPYIELSINGQRLEPREPITATAYSFLSADIVDEKVTTQKLAKPVREALVPAGAILMFSRESNGKKCPDGWSHFRALDDRFAMGAEIPGKTGGTSSHQHAVTVGEHDHPVSDVRLKIAFGLRNIGYDNMVTMRLGSNVGGYSSLTANQWFGLGTGMASPAPTGSNAGDVAVAGPAVTGATDAARFTSPSSADNQSNVPPYLTVIFCQKD